VWVGPMLRRCARGRGDDATVYGFRERRGAWRERGRTHVCLCVYGTRAAAPNRSTPPPSAQAQLTPRDSPPRVGTVQVRLRYSTVLST
jgi:hypothetical protein